MFQTRIVLSFARPIEMDNPVTGPRPGADILVKAREDKIAELVAAGKTDGIHVFDPPLVDGEEDGKGPLRHGCRLWVDLAAAESWIEFCNALYISHGHIPELGTNVEIV
jgi:hypothetical protein